MRDNVALSDVFRNDNKFNCNISLGMILLSNDFRVSKKQKKKKHLRNFKDNRRKRTASSVSKKKIKPFWISSSGGEKITVIYLPVICY